ncbi:MAG: ABC transporter ATP-binding protein [Planctomycetota bacterium]
MKSADTLWELTRGQRLRYGAAIAAMAVGYVFLNAVPLVIRDAVDRIEAGTPADRLWLAAALVLGLTTAGCVFVYLRARWAAIASEGIVRRLRDRLYAHLERLACTYFDQAKTGDLVQRCSSDVETIRVFMSLQVVEISRTVLLLAVIVPILFVLDTRMALVSLALFPVVFVFATLFFRRVKNLFKEVDEAEGALTSVLQENLTGIRVVRAFARQEFEEAKFAERNARHRDLHYRLFRLLGNYWGISDVLCMSQLGLTLICGAYWIRAGTLTVGTLYAFLTYVSVVIWPVRHLGRVLQDTGKATVALRRVQEILTQAEESDGGTELPLTGAIEVRELSFAFDSSRDALREVSFRLAAGETLALLGRPGAGKSTLVQLLLRLYDYEHGSIRLDGRELKTLSRRSVRAQVGVVMQEPFLYSKTIGANVRLGRSAATQDEIVASASAADMHGSIQEFEQGYDTLVGERGVTLSGGQRQRVALARALLKDAPILVLDDALSSVDTETEGRILEALRSRRGRRTTILIAHRISSVQHADRILVLDHGAVVQAGTHGALLKEDGPYRRLWRIQQEAGEPAGRPT